MKKLMFAAAAIAAGVAMADVTSANVVGYQGLGVADHGYTFMVATFDKVNGSVMKLSDIGVDENYGSSLLSFLNAADATTKTFEVEIEGVKQQVSGFMYIRAEDLEGSEFEGQPGWYYADGETGALIQFNDVDVPFGSMFYLEGAEECNIVASGVVVDDVQPIEVADHGYSFMGNCSPVDLKLSDIGVDENYGSSLLSFLNAADATTKTFEVEIEGVKQQVSGFMYIRAEDLEGSEFEGQPGWYYADGETGALIQFNNVDVPAGTMFYLEGAEETAILIPSAL